MNIDLVGYVENFITQGNWRNPWEMVNKANENFVDRSFQGEFITDGLLSVVHAMASERFYSVRDEILAAYRGC